MKKMEIKDLLCLSDYDKDREFIINISFAHVLRDHIMVEELKQQYPKAKILIDTKITDNDYLNAKIAFDAGADMVSVFAFANDESIKNTIQIADYCHGKVLADFVGVKNQCKRALDLDIYGVDYIQMNPSFHNEFDEVENDFIFCYYKISVPEYLNAMQLQEDCYL